MTTLFDPLQVGELVLPNRILMAPLTRCRASAGRVPNALMAEYYAQRADAGLILSEATSVCPQGVGYPDTRVSGARPRWKAGNRSRMRCTPRGAASFCNSGMWAGCPTLLSRRRTACSA